MVVAAKMITAVVVAGVLSFLFARNLKRHGKRAGFFWFFLFIFMITWASWAWIVPFGPKVLGIQWLMFLFIGLVGAVVLSFVAGGRYPKNRHETIDLLERVEKGRKLQNATHLPLKILFWVVLFILLVAIVFRYAHGPN